MTITEVTAHDWGDAPELYGPRHDYRESLVMRRLLPALPGPRVLNAGAGAGSLTLKLVDAGLEVTSVDASVPFCDWVRAALERRGIADRHPVIRAELGTGAVWARRNDERVIPVGRFLRRTRLDELPQLWNVLKGDMSFVGPRPERPEFVKELTRQIPFYGQRHVIQPGLTGWAQVCYTYGTSVEDAMEKLQYDLFYIKHLSLSFDVFIILKTIKTVVGGKGA